MAKNKNEVVEAETGEIIENGKLTLTQQAQQITLPNGVVVTALKNVTLPLLKQRDGETVYITVIEKMFLGKQLKAKDGESLPKRAEIVKVKSLIDNINYHFLVPAVLKDVFENDYAGDTYITKSFAIQKMPKVEGKRHKDLNIIEIGVS